MTDERPAPAERFMRALTRNTTLEVYRHLREAGNVHPDLEGRVVARHALKALQDLCDELGLAIPESQEAGQWSAPMSRAKFRRRLQEAGLSDKVLGRDGRALFDKLTDACVGVRPGSAKVESVIVHLPALADWLEGRGAKLTSRLRAQLLEVPKRYNKPRPRPPISRKHRQ